MKRHDIRFLNVLSLRGPNMWTYRPVLEAWVDIGELEDHPSNELPGFVDRLCAWLPTLAEHRCSYGEPGGFVRRLREGTWTAHILEHVTLELQNLAGLPGGFGKARETSLRAVYKVVVRAPYEPVTRACLECARELILAAIDDLPIDVAATHERLRALAQAHQADPDTTRIRDAATENRRRIPVISLSPGHLTQLGYGCHQRRIWRSATDRNGAIAEGIASDPELTRRMLNWCCLPVLESPGPDDRYQLLVVGDRVVSATHVAADGSRHDVRATLAPETEAAALLATRVVGLDIAGVDLQTRRIDQPLDPGVDGFIAVHAAPQLASQDEATAIIDHLFPDHSQGRIPVIGITGSRGLTVVARLSAEFLKLAGRLTGVACADGVFVGNRQIERENAANWRQGQRLLMNRAVEAAVIENGAEVILTEGLAYDRCQIGVVTRIDPAAHFGNCHITTDAQLEQVFRTQVDVVLPGGVAILTASDPRVAALAPLCDGDVIMIAASDHENVLDDHRQRGRRAVFCRDGHILLARGTEDFPLMPLAEVACLPANQPDDEAIEWVLAAIAAAWALEIAPHVIQTAAATFIHPDRELMTSAHEGSPSPASSSSPA